MAAMMSWLSSPRVAESRLLSSPAALLVKVMARMCQGLTGSTAQHARSASRPTSSPARYRSRQAAWSSVRVGGTESLWYPLPKATRLATRLMTAVVLPLPAPARISTGPSV